MSNQFYSKLLFIYNIVLFYACSVFYHTSKLRTNARMRVYFIFTLFYLNNLYVYWCNFKLYIRYICKHFLFVLISKRSEVMYLEIIMFVISFIYLCINNLIAVGYVIKKYVKQNFIEVRYSSVKKLYFKEFIIQSCINFYYQLLLQLSILL